MLYKHVQHHSKWKKNNHQKQKYLYIPYSDNSLEWLDSTTLLCISCMWKQAWVLLLITNASILQNLHEKKCID